MSKIVEVAAAVILRDAGREFLLACRPEGKVYAGYWEFPGGKLEAGESVREALVRELQEELGITVTAATPWLTREFTYPHATVRLHFWRVTAWDGEIGVTAPLEHSAVAWQTRRGEPTVTPVLPANAPILKALTLPEVMAISNVAENGIEAELARLESASKSGIALFQLRDKQLPDATRLEFAKSMRARIAANGGLLVINDDESIAREFGADGLHLSAGRLLDLKERPNFTWVGASCHNAEELAHASALGLDYALLGPVLPTQTHPEANGLGWATFAQLAEDMPIPVFALGGMQTDHLATAHEHGAHGIAMLRGW